MTESEIDNGKATPATSFRSAESTTTDSESMTILRRFLVLAALMFWQGGFMFYGAVVVPITRARLAEPSLITRDVTQWMNLVGTLAVLLLFVDVWAGERSVKRWRWVTWLGMAAPLPLLVWMHVKMSSQMALPEFSRSSMTSFLGSWHRLYLIVNTFQWLAGMAFTVLSLRAWRAEDAAPRVDVSRDIRDSGET